MCDMTNTPQREGYLHQIPTVIPAGMRVDGIRVATTPWFAPLHSGVVGVFDGQPALALTYEWPMTWLRSAERVDKFTLEWLFLRRFSTDRRLATGEHAFSQVERGPDPPDATVVTNAGKLGVESTAMTIGDRRGTYALFQRIRKRLAAYDPVSFEKLAGHLVYVWFNTDGQPETDRPFKKSDEAAADDLVRALASYSPRGEDLKVTLAPTPESVPELPLVTTTAGASFYAVPMVMSVPATPLFAANGFELGLAYTSMLTASAAWTEVQRLIDSHDKPGVDLLLITASGPDANGQIYPAEEGFAEFVVEHPGGLLREPEHIKSVILHFWLTGRAVELWPAPQDLFGPLYLSYVSAHHPIAPRTAAASTGGAQPGG
jgi:hypothetical protein